MLALPHLTLAPLAFAAPPSSKGAAFNTLSELYPPTAYGARRLVARDAALVHASNENQVGIPLAGDNLVYGEFDFDFFERLLELACPQPLETFVDLGSGAGTPPASGDDSLPVSTSRSPQIVLTFVCALHAGRIVLGAALLQPKLGLCHGIEILPELHEAAIAARVRLDEVAPKLPVAPCEYSALDLYTDAAAEALGSADILFSYSVTWERDEQGRLTELSRALASRLRPGARVITVDVTLLPEVGDVRFVPIASLEGANEETGPASTGHIFQVVKETSKASS